MFENLRDEPTSSSMPPLPSPFSAAATHLHDHEAHRFGCLYGASSAMRKVFRLIGRVAASDASVMIMGESGCGKELVAQTIHEMSGYASAPFIAINCGALPVSLIESELFGYERGAFTGANKTHQGFFERAQGGTLFLDEITEMPVDLQVRLLRVLETGSFTRVGGDREIRCNARILAATNREPLDAVRHGQLRQDLLYRLAVFPIPLPPLRERAEDVLLLAHHFLKGWNTQFGTQKHFAQDVAGKLCRHDWPGNVRELKNCIHRAYIMADKVVDIDIDTLVPLTSFTRPQERTVIEVEVGTPLEEVERRLIFATLDRYHGNKRRTAKALGISLKTIYNRLNSYADRIAKSAAEIHPSLA